MWDTVIKDRIDSVDVVVVKPGVVIEKNGVLTSSMLMVEKRNRSTLVEGAAHELSEVVGFETKRTLYGNSILSVRDVEFQALTPDPNKGESIRPIPNQWIYASPSTIRREDKIDFYLFKIYKDGETPTDTSIEYQGLSPEQKMKLNEIHTENEKENEEYQAEREKIAANKGIELPKKTVSTEDIEKTLEEAKSAFSEVNSVLKGEELADTSQDNLRKHVMKELNLTEQEWKSLMEHGDIPLLVDVPIIYVKDGSGNEILNGENSTEEKRLTSTGPVTDLEVILNEDEYRLIKEYMEKGYKLYISYN